MVSMKLRTKHPIPLPQLADYCTGFNDLRCEQEKVNDETRHVRRYVKHAGVFLNRVSRRTRPTQRPIDNHCHWPND